MNRELAKAIVDLIPEGRFSTLVDTLHSLAKQVDRYDYGLPLFSPHEEDLIKEVKDWFVDVLLDYPELFKELTNGD
jgi:hypothetical protein